MHKIWMPVFTLLLSASIATAFQQTIADSKPQNNAAPQDDSEKQRHELIEAAARRLVELQHEDGAWPYEGVYRVAGKIPVGYRIGGTAIACSALISANLKNRDAISEPVVKGTDMILKELEHRLMKPSKALAYDVRIWGHIYALDYFCRLKNTAGFEKIKKKTEPWIEKLVDAILFQEVKSGGWNYARSTRRDTHTCFVTAPAVQALILARQAGVDVDDDVFERSFQTLNDSRKSEGLIPYAGTRTGGNTTAGSIARAPVTEATMVLLGFGDQEKLQYSIDAFHEHWDELEKRRKKNGTHVAPHGIAPYYFYYGHRYAAQAIRMLPDNKQQKEFEKFKAVLMRTMDEDNTWNDRVFDQSKAFGTSMALLALSRDSVLLPKPIEVREKKAAESGG